MTAPFPYASALDAATVQMYACLSGLEADWHRRASACVDAESLSAEGSAHVARWRQPLQERLDDLYAEMTQQLLEMPPERRASAIAFHRRLVQPFFLQSPFCRRAIDKPLGYAGDYGLVEMIFAGREKTATPMGALLGDYSFGVGPSEAHRGRAPWAHRQIDLHLHRMAIDRPRLMSFACGPEVVLREWVRGGRSAEILLADHDPGALSWAKKQLLQANSPDRQSSVKTVEANAFALIKGKPVEEVLGGRVEVDVLLVLGLLDYLDDDQVSAFLTAVAPVLRPGGLLLLSNLHCTNPWRSMMEMTSDWNVAHRSVEGFEALVRATGRVREIRTEVHQSGTNLYCAATV